MKLYETVIFSTFTAFFMIDALNLSMRIRKLLKLDLLKQYTILKPLECPTCLSFWISIVVSLVFYSSLTSLIITPMATWIAVFLIEQYRMK